jgi:Arm DNA-binding domain/Phage integrase family
VKLHLTDLSVRSIKPAAAYATYWDDTTPGFGVRVGKRAKTWTIMRGTTRERVSIGRYPDMSLADARTKAKMLLAQAPEPKVAAILLKDAREQFLDENYRERGRRTKYHAARLLKNHFHTLDAKSLGSIDDGDIERCLNRIKDRPSEQLHAYRIVRCFLRWCTRPPRRFIRHSPMEGYAPPSKERRGTRILTDDELVAIWHAAASPTNRIVRLLILWGTRNTETASLDRAWVSDDALTIPGAHTKNGRDHTIPILPMAASVLDNLTTGNYRHYFPSRWGESHLSDGAWSKIKRDIQELSGTADWQLRDIRRTFRSNMARLKVPRDLCELLINHAPPVLDEIYDRYSYLDEKRDALERYERFLAPLIESRSVAQSRHQEVDDRAVGNKKRGTERAEANKPRPRARTVQVSRVFTDIACLTTATNATERQDGARGSQQ